MKIAMFLLITIFLGCCSSPPCVPKCTKTEQKVVRKLTYMGLTATTGVASTLPVLETICIEYQTVCVDMNLMVNKK